MTVKYRYHRETIENIINHFCGDTSVLAVLLGGSIAHGYSKKHSDVDIIIIVSEKEYLERRNKNDLLFFSRELAAWDRGYVDGKFISVNYLKLVAEKGNEPSRYAFKDSKFLLLHDTNIPDLVQKAAEFNEKNREINACRFFAQMQAWKWYFYEGKKHGNHTLMSTAVSNFILYSCRIILNHNKMLYPYHKWMMEELKRAEIKPEGIVSLLNKLSKHRKASQIETISHMVQEMKTCDIGEHEWPEYFRRDIETVWIDQQAHISDI